MRRFFALRPMLVVCALISGAFSVHAAPDVRTVRNAYFEIVGLDVRSLSYVNELSQLTVEIAERYLEREGLAFPLPILISLRPEAHVAFEGDYQIRQVERGAVQLDVRWEDSLTLTEMCYAVSEALIIQYARYNHGPGAAQSVCAWPIEALANEVHLALRPAHFIEILKQARSAPLPELSLELERGNFSGERGASFGYWFLLSLKNSELPRKVLRAMYQQAIAGIDVGEALESAIQSSVPTAEPLQVQDWWAMQLDQLLGQEYEVIDSMGRSRDWLSDLAGLTQPLVLESGEEVALNLRSIWKYREDPQIQEMVQARYEILRLRMLRVNPAYFNAGRSLGALFESLLGEVPTHRYVHALAIYLSDWEDAKEMQDQIEEILNQD